MNFNYNNLKYSMHTVVKTQKLIFITYRIMLTLQQIIQMKTMMKKKRVNYNIDTLYIVYYTNIYLLFYSYFSDLCLRKPSSISELRRKQTTAVILMGVMGAEFGQEVSASDNVSTSSRSQPGSSIRRKSSIVEGFGIGNNNLSRLTSTVILY